MTITIPPHVVDQLRDSAARGDATLLRQQLADALDPIVQSLLRTEIAAQSVAEFDALMNELDNLPDSIAAPALSDQAMSREIIYEDHP